MEKTIKSLHIIMISTIILISVLISTSISFYIHFNDSNTKSYCIGNICIEYDVNPCQGGALFDTEIFIVNRFVIFYQSISSYCDPPLTDSNSFRIELSLNGSVLIVREIFTTDIGVSRCVCPFGVNGKISNLLPGSYNLVFIFDNRYVMQTLVLKEFKIWIL